MQKKIIIFLSMIIIISGCSNSNINQNTKIQKEERVDNVNQSDPTLSNQPIEILSYDDFVNNLSSSDKNWSGLNTEQYIEDFDYLYQQLKENYPFFGVAKRKKNMDLESRYFETRKKLATCKNDVDFLNILRSDFSISIGHMAVWGTRYSSKLKDLETLSEEKPEYKEQYIPYIQALDNPVSRKNYEAMELFYNKQDKEYNAYLKEMGKFTKEAESDTIGELSQTANVKTDILEGGKIAYINIEEFDMSSYDEDKEILYDFYNQIANYEHLIFDISENPGGGMSYFTDLLVAPNISQTLSAPVYEFAKAGQNNTDFLQLEKGISSGEWRPVSEAPVLPRMNADDLKELDYFSDSSYIVDPIFKDKIFKGEIWLLVSAKNYSSSEFAAMFSKNTGFATLVGTNTDGDGIGTDPAFIVLPNSGVVVQYSPIYGTTADGANSEEYGTKPDYESPTGETPLDTCLKLIELRAFPKY